MTTYATKKIKTIAITYGEPAGIGPDLVLQLFKQSQFQNIQFVIIGDRNVIADRAKALTTEAAFEEYDSESPITTAIKIIHIASNSQTVAGQLDRKNSAHVLACLDAAIDGCLNYHFDAMVTCPVHKGIINESGISFTGHTEYLAKKCNIEKVVMMLCENNSAYKLRVALVTTHLPLSKVAEAITSKELESTLQILKSELQQRFNINSPHIFVCGLNPHAGEDGHLGKEEQRIIEPSLNKLRSKGFNLTGPLPADTLFIPDNLKQADAVVAMYHDQGLPMLKHLGFGQAINVTLGLPFIRTSVDHGTALELAGTGKAKASSLFNAILLADKMSAYTEALHTKQTIESHAV